MSEQTLVQSMIERGGVMKAFKALTLLASWGIATRAEGHDLTWQQYSDHWRQSMSTTTREMRAFKACFGDEATPVEVWRHIEGQMPALVPTDRKEMAKVLAGVEWAA